MTSAAVESLGTITLTADWQETPKHVRMDSHSQLQFFADYNPDPLEIIAAVGEVQVEILYSSQAGDTNLQSGASFTWKGYTEEVDQGDGSSLFQVRVFRITAASTENFERDPTFSRPLGGKVVKCRAREVGVSHFGTIALSVSTQRI